ncbi:MAG: DUF1326 domain-containing protein [Pseudonocardia sp.]|nr:DUF1326 domain-containing protein [Pseudonocardia sp.]
MSYQIEGSFIEACDCYVVCPCWVDDEPDEGHCTGLFAWQLDTGSLIAGVDVGGCTVVAVTTHQGGRREPRTTTVLYVDDGASPAQRDQLGMAFSGRLEGALGDLAAVSGKVVAIRPARIVIDPDESNWSVRVLLLDPATRTPFEPAVPLVEAFGSPKLLEKQAGPLRLTHTALSDELGIGPGTVTAQQGRGLALHAGELPNGGIEVHGRSGMRGRFRYQEPPAAGIRRTPPPAD